MASATQYLEQPTTTEIPQQKPLQQTTSEGVSCPYCQRYFPSLERATQHIVTRHIEANRSHEDNMARTASFRLVAKM